MQKRILKKVLSLVLVFCCTFNFAGAVLNDASGDDNAKTSNLNRDIGWQKEYLEDMLEIMRETFGEVTSTMIGDTYSSDSLGYFGAMWYWLQFETGYTDDRAFDMVTLNDGEGGQAYGVQFDLDQGSLMEFLTYCVNSDPTKWSMFAPFIGKSASELRASSQSDPLPTAWHQAYSQYPDDFKNIQKDYLYNNYYKPIEEKLKGFGHDLTQRSDVCKGAIFSWVHQWGYGRVTKDRMDAAGLSPDDDDKTFLTKLYDWRINNQTAYAARYCQKKL